MNRFLSAVVVFSMIGCGGSNDTTGSSGGSLQSEDLTVGTGATAATGDTLTVNYIGTLQSGAVFDSSYARNQPFTFRLGAGQVIRGWDQGLVGMKVGGKRRLTIPADLAYGSQGNGPIPPNATIVFEIDLVSIAGK